MPHHGGIRRTAPAPPLRGLVVDAGVHLKHALVRDAAYGSLLLTTRRRLHESCGRRLLEQDIFEVVRSAPELVARHFARANLAGNAARFYER